MSNAKDGPKVPPPGSEILHYLLLLGNWQVRRRDTVDETFDLSVGDVVGDVLRDIDHALTIFRNAGEVIRIGGTPTALHGVPMIKEGDLKIIGRTVEIDEDVICRTVVISNPSVKTCMAAAIGPTLCLWALVIT